MPVSKISPEREQALRQRMDQLGIRDKDLEEQFVRSSGKGGQNVNKVATCVVLRHRLTGLMVKCQDQRGQAVNRFTARVWLCDKVAERQQRQAAAQTAAKEKVRRQRRAKPKALKEKILEEKRKLSLKKQSRRRFLVRRVETDG